MEKESENKQELKRSLSKRKKPTSIQGVQLVPLILKSATTAGLLFGVWGIGWLKLSVSWVIGASALFYAGKQYVKYQKKIEEIENEDDITLARVDELPSWVYFPDVERAEWLNKMIQQMWPYIGDHVCRTIRSMEKGIDEKIPSILKPFRFDEITLGNIPPRLGGIKVYIDNVNRTEIVMDAEITYAGDSDINISFRSIKAGIKDILLHGTMRLIFRPLVNQIPIIAGVEFCFLNNPNLDFDFTNIANVLDVPLLNDSLRKIITDQLSNVIVLPNVIKINIANDDILKSSNYNSYLSGNSSDFNLPSAVVLLKIIEADDLKRADAGKIFGKGKSDPYAKIFVGNKVVETKHIIDTISPRWDEKFEFIIDDPSRQEIEIQVFDHDDHIKDDFLGKAYLRVQELVEKSHIEKWVKLVGVKTGRIYFSSDIFFPTIKFNDPYRVKPGKNSSAILKVIIESARDLPLRASKGHGKGLIEPSPQVILLLGQQKVNSSHKIKTTNPRWNEKFDLLVSQPENEILFIQVQDTAKNNEILGTVNFKINTLLPSRLSVAKENDEEEEEENDDVMIIRQPFPLTDAKGSCSLTLSFCLRFLTRTNPENVTLQTNSNEHIPDSSTDDVMLSNNENILNSAPNEGLRYRSNRPNKDVKRGEIEISLRFNEEKEVLLLTIHKCRNLVAYDRDNFSDPYVNVYLKPDKNGNSKQKTSVVKNNLNPIWEHTFEWQLQKRDLPNKTIEIMVKNHIGTFERRTERRMGLLTLNLIDFNNINKPFNDWFHLQDPTTLLGSL